MTTLRGATPIVQVQDLKERELEMKAREILLNREITAVFLSKGQLTLHLEDGGSFTMNCEGGFLEVS